MKKVVIAVVVGFFLLPSFGLTQTEEKIDPVAVAKFKTEGLENSQVMDIMNTLCNVYGPRLGWSPEYKRAAEWASGKLKDWGLQNVHYDYWAPLGKGWSLKYFSAMVTSPVPFPVIGYPLAWSPGIRQRDAEVVYLNAKKPEDLDSYKGKLKGKYVCINDPVELKAPFEPLAIRMADSVLLKMANADLEGGGRRFRRFPRNIRNIDSALAYVRQFNPSIDSASFVRMMQERMMAPRKLEFAQQHGALAVITTSRGDGGNLIVQSAQVPQPEDVPYSERVQAYSPKAPEIVPQVVFAAEDYNRIVRALEQGTPVRLDMKLDVTFTKADSGFNIIGEIPGTDLKDEVVQIGGHFDSWHGGTGATDDGAGTGACMEAVRILQTLAQKYNMHPRRTIRISLWGSEEEGLIGSREYVSQVYAKREGDQGMFGRGSGPLTKTAAYDKFSVYFNDDNGTGRFRGIYLQGNEAARSIFRSWFTAYADPTAQTITIENTGGTDHLSFDAVGLPGFQFIQDPIDYSTRTHHFIMDVYDRLQPDDMKQAATIMAFFAYEAANRDGQFPRKPMQEEGTTR